MANLLVRGFLVASLLAIWSGSARAEKLEGVVNINTASTEELELLPGVGPAKAKLIIEYRQKHAFRTVEELARVKGIGPKTVRRLRPYLVVRGPTTAQPTSSSRRAKGEPDPESAADQPTPGS